MSSKYAETSHCFPRSKHLENVFSHSELCEMAGQSTERRCETQRCSETLRPLPDQTQRRASSKETWQACWVWLTNPSLLLADFQVKLHAGLCIRVAWGLIHQDRKRRDRPADSIRTDAYKHGHRFDLSIAGTETLSRMFVYIMTTWSQNGRLQSARCHSCMHDNTS